MVQEVQKFKMFNTLALGFYNVNLDVNLAIATNGRQTVSLISK